MGLLWTRDVIEGAINNGLIGQNVMALGQVQALWGGFKIRPGWAGQRCELLL